MHKTPAVLEESSYTFHIKAALRIVAESEFDLLIAIFSSYWSSRFKKDMSYALHIDISSYVPQCSLILLLFNKV